MNYGSQTVCRPRLGSLGPGGHVRAGAALAECPYCGHACWKLPQEPDPLPPDTASMLAGLAATEGASP